jgi:hypothetical protein
MLDLVAVTKRVGCSVLAKCRTIQRKLGLKRRDKARRNGENASPPPREGQEEVTASLATGRYWIWMEKTRSVGMVS